MVAHSLTSSWSPLANTINTINTAHAPLFKNAHSLDLLLNLGLLGSLASLGNLAFSRIN